MKYLMAAILIKFVRYTASCCKVLSYLLLFFWNIKTHMGFCICVSIPQKYIFKIIIILTSSCDEIFHQDTHSHFCLSHTYLDRIDWISLIDYDIPKITIMLFIVLCSIVTTNKLLFLWKLVVCIIDYASTFTFTKAVASNPSMVTHSVAPAHNCTSTLSTAGGENPFQLYITLKLHANN